MAELTREQIEEWRIALRDGYTMLAQKTHSTPQGDGFKKALPQLDALCDMALRALPSDEPVALTKPPHDVDDFYKDPPRSQREGLSEPVASMSAEDQLRAAVGDVEQMPAQRRQYLAHPLRQTVSDERIRELADEAACMRCCTMVALPSDVEHAIRTALSESVSRDAVLEEAAKVCDEEATIEGIAQKCAARIRSLKGRSHE